MNFVFRLRQEKQKAKLQDAKAEIRVKVCGYRVVELYKETGASTMLSPSNIGLLLDIHALHGLFISTYSINIVGVYIRMYHDAAARTQADWV